MPSVARRKGGPFSLLLITAILKICIDSLSDMLFIHLHDIYKASANECDFSNAR